MPRFFRILATVPRATMCPRLDAPHLASTQSEEMRRNYRPTALVRISSMSTEITLYGARVRVEKLPLPTIAARFALC
jgi:hypothetical protein